MNGNNTKSSFSAIGLILSLFFSLIAIYVLFGIFELAEWDEALPLTVTFVAVNLLSLIGISAFGGAISNKFGTPALGACWTTATVYTIAQFASLFIFMATVSQSDTSHLYVLANLVFIFVSLLITLPILKSGSIHKDE